MLGTAGRAVTAGSFVMPLSYMPLSKKPAGTTTAEALDVGGLVSMAAAQQWQLHAFYCTLPQGGEDHEATFQTWLEPQLPAAPTLQHQQTAHGPM